MALSGSFASMPLQDLLTWLGDSRKDGLLTVVLEFEESYFRMRQGKIVAHGSDDARVRDLARVLLGRGVITEAVGRAALRAQAASGRSLRRVLVEDGLVRVEALDGAVRAHVKDVVLQLFLWTEGRFVWSDEGSEAILSGPELAQLEHVIMPPIASRELVMDGLRRLDEHRRIAQVFPSDYVFVFALGRAPDLPSLDVLAEFGEPTPLRDLCAHLPRPRFDVLSELFQAHQRGLLAVDATVGEPPPTTRGGDSVDVLVAKAEALIGEEHFDEAYRMLRGALDLNPFHSTARAALARARAAQLVQLYEQFPPFMTPALRVDRRRLSELKLTRRERYLTTRIDGQRDIATLTVMTPLGELETLRALARLHRLGLLALG